MSDYVDRQESAKRVAFLEILNARLLGIGRNDMRFVTFDEFGMLELSHPSFRLQFSRGNIICRPKTDDVTKSHLSPLTAKLVGSILRVINAGSIQGIRVDFVSQYMELINGLLTLKQILSEPDPYILKAISPLGSDTLGEILKDGVLANLASEKGFPYSTPRIEA